MYFKEKCSFKIRYVNEHLLIWVGDPCFESPQAKIKKTRTKRAYFLLFVHVRPLQVTTYSTPNIKADTLHNPGRACIAECADTSSSFSVFFHEQFSWWTCSLKLSIIEYNGRNFNIILSVCIRFENKKS